MGVRANIRPGVVIIFPCFGTPGLLQPVDEVRIFDPPGQNTRYLSLPIALPPGASAFQHLGGKGLRIRFISADQGVMVTTINSQEMVTAMRILYWLKNKLIF
jgi:hypothetical protein